MTYESLSFGRAGLILLIIAQVITTTVNLIFPGDLLYYGMLLLLGFSILFANFIFRYFDQAFDSTLAKVTFIFTLIGVLGVMISAVLILIAAITLSLILIAITLILVLFILPAELVFYLLWGATFIVVRENVNNPSLMLAGGILFLIGIISGLFLFGFLTFLAIIGLILVTIVMFSEGKGA
ncbi:MAG: hypothetical protein ACFFCO_04895 [Promethearchaeota archaeon]